jgi:hypothetical protein
MERKEGVRGEGAFYSREVQGCDWRRKCGSAKNLVAGFGVLPTFFADMEGAMASVIGQPPGTKSVLRRALHGQTRSHMPRGPEHAVDTLLYFCRHRVSQHDQFTVRNSFSACSKSTGISTKRKLKE